MRHLGDGEIDGVERADGWVFSAVVARRAARRARAADRRRRPARSRRAAAVGALGARRSCRCSGSSAAARSSTSPAPTAELGARAEAAAALEAQLGLEPVKVEDAALARFLEEQGRLVRVGDGYAISAEAYERARDALVAECEAAGRISLARFRDLLGVGRKTAQLLLERFDADGLTRRVGDERVLRRRGTLSQ